MMNTLLSRKVVLICFLMVIFAGVVHANPVGLGGYATEGHDSVPGALKVVDGFQQPVQTNDWWTSLIWDFKEEQPHSLPLFPHPLGMHAQAAGLNVSYPDYYTINSEYHYPSGAIDFTIGTPGLYADQTKVASYSDWAVTAQWGNTLQATIGHGFPYIYIKKLSGDSVSLNFPTGVPSVWYESNGVIGLTVNRHHYGIFAPTGSSWSGHTLMESRLNGKDYFSVAVLPDNSPATLEFFRKHAYSFITDTKASWNYDETTATIASAFTATVSQKESGNGISHEPLMALYRHQWINSDDVNTSYTYVSPRGEMRVVAGTSFSTHQKFSGVIPAMPDEGNYDRNRLYNYVNDLYAVDDIWSLAGKDTYWQGKHMGMIAQLIRIADQVGHTSARDRFLSALKTKLQDWFTVGGSEFYYNETWDYLVGFPASFHSDVELNDHDFHWGYFIQAAAMIAQYDPDWAADNQWGGMVKLLIKDAANSDRFDTRFPFLRSFDAYAGHNWANGPAAFGAGNNEESSSEAMNFASGVILFGAATGDTSLRDLGIFMYSNMLEAIEQYWFDMDNEVFPNEFPYQGVGMVWSNGGAHATWFSGEPECIYGINMLPFTGGSLYLGHNPAYVQSLYTTIVSENGGVENEWRDIIWNYQAFADPQAALDKFSSGNYDVFAGESKAHTYHWLHNLNAMGNVDASVTANVPTYAVFNKNGTRTYVAYNPDYTAKTVRFSDGKSLFVPARSMVSGDGGNGGDVYNLTISPAGITTGSGSYEQGTDVNISFTGSGFQRWTGDTRYVADLDSASTTVTMPAVDIELTAQYTSDNPRQIPGLIEAEDYSNYYDTTPGNTGEAFKDDDVDIQDCSNGGYNIGWIEADEWLEYDVTVKESGKYNVSVQVASKYNEGNLRIYMDGNDVTGLIRFDATSGWQNWTDITVNDIDLTAGSQLMRISFESSEMNINSVTFEKADPQPDRHQIPGLIEAEDYSNYYDTTPGNTGEAFKDDDVDIQDCSNGGYNIGWIETGEWLEYDVNVQETGKYNVTLQVASNYNVGNLRIYMDGNDVTGLIRFDATSGWQNWTDITVKGIDLTAGSQLMRISFESTEMNINRVEFEKSSGTGFQFSGTMPNGLVDGQQVDYHTTASFDGSVVTVTFGTTTALNKVYLFTPDFNSMVQDGAVWKKELTGFSEGDTLTWHFVAIGNGQADSVPRKLNWTVDN